MLSYIILITATRGSQGEHVYSCFMKNMWDSVVVLSCPEPATFSHGVSCPSVTCISFDAFGYFMALFQGCHHIMNMHSFFILCDVIFPGKRWRL